MKIKSLVIYCFNMLKILENVKGICMQGVVGKFLLITFMSSMFVFADLSETIESFEKRPGYVQPIGTFMGSFANQGWNHGARVTSGTSFRFGLGISFAFIDDADQTYQLGWDRCGKMPEGRINECPDYNQATGQIDLRQYTLPTIFGPLANQNFRLQEYLPLLGGGARLNHGSSVSDGNEHLRELPFLLLPFFDIGFAHKHTEYKLRYMGLGAIFYDIALGDSELNHFIIAGLGVQHDITRFIPAELPIDISVSTNISRWGIKFTPPKKDFSGDLTLFGYSSFTSLVLGYTLKPAEFFSEIGWEYANMRTTGTVVDFGDDGIANTSDDVITNANLQENGRNGFRISIGMAFQFGSYSPLLATSAGAQNGVHVNVFNFKKDY
jgi:hypothetical protein